MINGLFEEISEQEIMSVNGGCGGGSPSPGNTKATPPEPKTEKTGSATAYVIARIAAEIVFIGHDDPGIKDAWAHGVSGY